MNNLQNIAALIQIRNFLQGSLDNLGIKLSTAQINEIRKKVALLDQSIIDNSLLIEVLQKKEYSFTSTEDTADVLQKAILATSSETKKGKVTKSNEVAK